MVKVSIALPTYNRASLLEECVRSVLSQSVDDYELIIIDDGSRDETSRIVEGLVRIDPRIRYYRNRANIGLQKSRNLAVSLARTEFVFFIEDDLFLYPDCLKFLCKSFNELLSSGIKVGAIGPRLIEAGSNRRRIGGIGPVVIDKFTGMVITDFGLDCQMTMVPTLHSCSMISKSVFRDIGGYDYHLYTGTSFREETDLYFRARKLGYKLFYQPSSIAIHRKVSFGGCGKPRLREGYFEVRNHILFLSKSFGIASFFMIPCYLVSTVFRARRFLASKESEVVQ